MEDIIDIIVTETTNLIEITSQPTDEVIDVNIIDNREDITLNVTPSVVEININSLTGNFGVEWGDITGTLSNQIDLNTALSLKADLVDGKVPPSQLPSYVDDVVEVANYASLPANGEVGKIYITLDTNLIYRWTGSTYVEIKDSSAVWGAITGTLSSQTDLQNALNAKQNQLNGTGFVKATGTTISYDNSTYLTTSVAANTYLSRAGGEMTGQIILKVASSSTDYTKGLKFPDNPGTGTGDISGLRLYVDSAENQVLELYVGNDTGALGSVDKINFATGVGGTPNNDCVTINGNIIWNAGNLTPQSQLNGTGFVKASGTTITYDNSTYLTTSSAASTYLTISTAASTYLAKTGGTLTGALSGTSATFSGTVQTSLLFSTDATRNVYINPAADLGNGALPTIQVASNHALQFATNNTLRLTIGASTGAATFSSTVESLRYLATSSSASLPAFACTSGNGMYNAGTNAIGFSTNSSPRVIIDANGYLGINTTTPGARLDVVESTSNTYGIIQVRGNNRGGALEFYNGSTVTAAIYSLTTNDLLFYNGTGYTERMRIKSNGIINLSNVPSSATGLSSGDIYKTVAGVLMIV